MDGGELDYIVMMSVGCGEWMWGHLHGQKFKNRGSDKRK